jgi:hypothetical protein
MSFSAMNTPISHSVLWQGKSAKLDKPEIFDDKGRFEFEGVWLDSIYLKTRIQTSR